MKKFNINEIIKVKLNEKGIQHYIDWYNNIVHEHWKIKEVTGIQKDGYKEFQMWHFMEVYGEVMGMGIQSYFDNDILIDIK